jgi:signal transduction histidine kinase
VLLVTNFVELHELVYRSSSFVDDGGGLNVRRGPAFWVHIVVIYLLVFLSTALFGAEWANSSGLRRRQAAIMLLAPVVGLGASAIWFLEVVPFPFDPTPMGTTVGVVLLGWVLYRSKFVEIVPVARHAVVEEMVDAVAVVDVDDRVVDWNAEAAHRFDNSDASPGISAEEFFDPIPNSTLARFVDTTQTETKISVEHGGTEQHYAVSISPIESEDGRLLGRVLVVRNVTDERRREEQLLKQNEYLDRFAGIVSHDLQGPLMEIRASADAALRSGDVSHVESVVDATDRIDRLVDDLLRLARTGRQVDDVTAVELSEAAETAWRRVWSTNATLAVETDAVVLADRERLLQLLENLFRNAVQHGSTGGQNGTNEAETGSGPPDRSTAFETADTTGDDTTAATAEDAGVHLTVGELESGFYVADDGPGISPTDRDRVFERGYTTTTDGTGLGLSIVRQIASAHGWIVLVTDGEHGGARFELRSVDTPQDSATTDS